MTVFKNLNASFNRTIFAANNVLKRAPTTHSLSNRKMSAASEAPEDGEGGKGKDDAGDRKGRKKDGHDASGFEQGWKKRTNKWGIGVLTTVVFSFVMKAYYYDEKRFSDVTMELGTTRGLIQATQRQIISLQELQTAQHSRLAIVESKVGEIRDTVKHVSQNVNHVAQDVGAIKMMIEKLGPSERGG